MKKCFFSSGPAGAGSVAILPVAVLLVAVLTAAAPVAAAGAGYSDVREGSWACEAISAMSEAGVIEGFPDGSFRPAEHVTYGEFIKMACIAATGEDPGVGNGGEWALPYHEAALEAGFYARREIANADLSRAIPREYMALVLSGILGDAADFDYDAVRERITDVEWDAPHEYDIVKATALGLLTGYPDGSFRPAETLTRAEAATVIHRLVNADARRLPDLADASEKTPAERLAEVPEGDISPLDDVMETSSSKRPISEVLDDAMFNMLEEPVLHYEVFEGYPYRMKKTRNLVDEEILVVGYKGVEGFLIKDRRIIAEVHAGTHRGEEVVSIWDDRKAFPDFDYIAVQPIDKDVTLLIPNNL
ncbi:MAG: S-layer homology domain-containing protein [Clostridiales Family XIII bacterium]|jgi:hypothetical protein|nr:S-layer homology domain-containing protein [Clostridiales Family XIII bacterium]